MRPYTEKETGKESPERSTCQYRKDTGRAIQETERE